MYAHTYVCTSKIILFTIYFYCLGTYLCTYFTKKFLRFGVNSLSLSLPSIGVYLVFIGTVWYRYFKKKKKKKNNNNNNLERYFF